MSLLLPEGPDEQHQKKHLDAPIPPQYLYTDQLKKVLAPQEYLDAWLDTLSRAGIEQPLTIAKDWKITTDGRFFTQRLNLDDHPLSALPQGLAQANYVSIANNPFIEDLSSLPERIYALNLVHCTGLKTLAHMSPAVKWVDLRCIRDLDDFPEELALEEVVISPYQQRLKARLDDYFAQPRRSARPPKYRISHSTDVSPEIFTGTDEFPMSCGLSGFGLPNS